MKWINVNDDLPELNTLVDVRSIDEFEDKDEKSEFEAELNETMSGMGSITHEWYTPDGFWIPSGITEWRHKQ
jgi:hypothetical protein